MGNVTYKETADCYQLPEDEGECGCRIATPWIGIMPVSSTLSCPQREYVGNWSANGMGVCPDPNNPDVEPKQQPDGSCQLATCDTYLFKRKSFPQTEVEITCCHGIQFIPEDPASPYADGYPEIRGYYLPEPCPGTEPKVCCPDNDCSQWEFSNIWPRKIGSSNFRPILYPIAGSGTRVNADGDGTEEAAEEPEDPSIGDIAKFNGATHVYQEIKDEEGNVTGEEWVALDESGENGGACADEGAACTGCGEDDCGGIMPASQQFADYPEYKSVPEYYRELCIYDPSETPVWPWECGTYWPTSCNDPENGYGSPYRYPTLQPGQGFADSAFNLSICNTATNGGKYKQRMKFKLAHSASVTCYLKVWAYKKYTFFPCRIEEFNSGPWAGTPIWSCNRCHIAYVANEPCPPNFIICDTHIRRVFAYDKPVVWYEEWFAYEWDVSGTYADPAGGPNRCADLSVVGGQPTPMPRHLKLANCSEVIVDSTEHEIFEPSVPGTTIEVVLTYSIIRGYKPDPPNLRVEDWHLSPTANKDGFPNRSR